MTEATITTGRSAGSALQCFPSLKAPPSKPKKSPSPRLTPRRCSRQSPVTDRALAANTMMGGQENNVTTMRSDSPSVSSAAAHPRTVDSSSKGLVPVEKTGSPVVRKRGRRKHEGRENQAKGAASHAPAPQSPSQQDQSSTSTSASTPPSSSKSKPESRYDPFEFVDDDEFAPLTPRSLIVRGHDDEAQVVTLTPPVNPPTPLFVSAKKHGARVRRRTFSTKRRRPNDDAVSEEDDTMKLPEGLSPAEKAREYWKRCYGTQQPQQVQINPQTSWSAKRVAPAKGW